MKLAWWLASVVCGVVLGAAFDAAAAEDNKKEDKERVVELGSLKSKVPEGWKPAETKNALQIYRFTLPHAKDDKSEAELVIFHFNEGSGGSVEDNVKRWKGMILPPEGKKIDDVSKLDKFKVGVAAIAVIDVEGTYLARERPFDPSSKTEKKPDYRLLGIVFEIPKDAYYMRMTGPAKTVAEHKKAFDEWLKNFK
jgi:hypothetical protein